MTDETHELVEGYAVRPARIDDLEAACAIAKAAWEPIHESFIEILGREMHDTLSPDWRAAKAEQIVSHFERHPDWMFVVDDAREGKGSVVAFITFGIDEGRSLGTIGNNAVLAEVQGRGIGTAMYRRVLDHFRSLGLRYANVQTGLDRGHAAARKAYERAGFDIAREAVTYYVEL